VNRIFMPVAVVASTLAVAVAHASSPEISSPPPPETVCEDIASHIEPINDLMEVFTYPLGQLAKGPNPILEQAQRMGRPDKRVLETMFRPTPDLDKIFARYSEPTTDIVQVLGFPSSDFHALWSLGGSDHCMTFEFFNASKNEKAQLLPPLPVQLRADGEGLCEPHAGYLVRAYGRVGFLVRDEGADYSVALRYLPFEHGEWGKGCRVNLAVPTVYDPVRVFVAKDGPIKRAELEKVLPKLIEAKMLARRNGETFRFSDTAVPPVRLEGHPHVEIFQKPGEDFGFPLFGSDDPVGAKYLISKYNTELVSIRLNGRAYLMRAGSASPFSGKKWPTELIILYRVDDERGVIVLDEKAGRGAPVASAAVEMRPGKPTISFGPIQ
jgi:hypothetical protein